MQFLGSANAWNIFVILGFCIHQGQRSLVRIYASASAVVIFGNPNNNDILLQLMGILQLISNLRVELGNYGLDLMKEC